MSQKIDDLVNEAIQLDLPVLYLLPASCIKIMKCFSYIWKCMLW